MLNVVFLCFADRTDDDYFLCGHCGGFALFVCYMKKARALSRLSTLFTSDQNDLCVQISLNYLRGLLH